MKAKYIKYLSVSSAILLTVTSITGCSRANAQTKNSKEELTELTSLPVKYKDEDINASYDISKASKIELDSDKINISGSGASANGSVLTITDAGVYVLSGNLTDGQIIIDAKKTDKVQLVLNGVEINCSNSSAIYSKQSKKTIVTLSKDTTNTLTDGTTYNHAEGEDEPNATIYAKDDLTINGTGSLTVDGKFKHGIASKDDLIITGGNININSVNNGLRGKDSVSIKNGNFIIKSGGDGIKSSNDKDTTKGFISIDGGTFDITSDNDGIQAETTLQVNNGDFNIITGEGSANNDKAITNGRPSHMDMTPPDGEFDPHNKTTVDKKPKSSDMGAPDRELPPHDKSVSDKETTSDESEVSTKGMKASTSIIINDGTLNIDSYDDSIHSDGDLIVNNGKITFSSGDDGIHADNQVIIEDGSVDISKSYEGIEGKTVTINGGEIKLNASDDGINASDPEDASDGRPGQSNDSCFIRISGGEVVVNADGDGIDSNGNLYVDGGDVLVNGPTSNGDSGLDFDGISEITGGTLAATGGASMAQVPGNTSSQNSLAVYYKTMQEAEAKVSINDEKGNTIYSFTPSKQYQFVVISTPDLQKGKTYTLLSGTKELTDFNISDVVTSISEDGSKVNRDNNGMGGMRRP